MSLPAQQSTLQQQITALTKQLAPATFDEIDVVLNGLMDGGMMFPATIKAKDKIGEYRKAMSDCPSVGLRKVSVKLKRGEYDNVNLAFIPLPAELAAMARAEARTEREDRQRLRERAKAIEEQSARPEPRDPEMIARVKAARERYMARHADEKAMGQAPEKPMDEERAAYLQQIMAMRDAPEISAEQAAFRRKAAFDIAKTLPERKEAAE